MWRCYLADTMSGQLAEPIDIPSFSWTTSISDSSMSTTRDKGAGAYEASGLELPWTAVPGATQAARHRAIASYRRSIVLMWEDAAGRVPVVVGAVGPRLDSWLDTSFELVSMMNLLGQRIVVAEGAYGKGNPNGTTTADLAFGNRSLRAIASEIGQAATGDKPGGYLPIDWPYKGEGGKHQRTYFGHNAQNNDYAKLLGAMTNVMGGPDAQLRPYLADETHVRHRLEMGTDASPELAQTGLVRTLTAFPGGGTLEEVSVAHTAPVMRVYAHGAGQDKAQLGYLAQDLTLVQQSDPWPLIEETASFTDDEKLSILQSHAQARLAAASRPLAQVTGSIWLDDPATPSITEIWPGQIVSVSIQGHPGLPDGTYDMRLMEMRGDQTSRVGVTFDPILDPWEA